ncbi:MAG: peptide chain release factor N(5)-glutamine methyltransferase [Bacteroidetes bacterium]|nr:peptide chain release factor N(5)-glutamine methyltransferase [Bacteroidota bacterium]
MQIASNKIKDVVRFFREQLQGMYDASEIESFIGLCFEEYLGLKRVDIVINGERTISESDLLKFNFAIKDLKNEKPIQQILGKADFYGLKFYVNEHVLIPRPETEELVDLIIKENKDFNPAILDIGTGSGCIPISLRKNIPNAMVSSIDVSEKALEVAKKNAEWNQVEINFILDDILNPSKEIAPNSFDIIVSNPPYIRISEKEEMSNNVLKYEPHLALFVYNDDPLLFYKKIADVALKGLKPQGKIYFEINENFGAECKQMLENKGFKNVVLVKDLSNKNRILRGSF